MSSAEKLAKFLELRLMREDAWTVVRADIDQLRSDLSARGIGERMKDRVAGEALEVWDHTMDVAESHKGIVAATMAALVAWLLRGPITAAVEGMFGDKDEPHDPPRGTPDD